MSRAKRAIDEIYLTEQYARFKERYITPGPDILIQGNKHTSFKVQNTSATDYDITSRNMGYGMLLAVMLNDQETFDGLYAYVRAHQTRSDGLGLMHRRVDKNNTDESEFGIPVPHGKAYMNKNDYLLPDIKRRYISATRTMYSFVSMTEFGNISKADLITLLLSDNRIADGDANDWIPASSAGRQLNSVTDADLDITMALIIASRRWPNLAYESNPAPGFDYRVEAAANIRNVLLFDVNTDGFLNNGSLGNNIDGTDQFFPSGQGDRKRWNPSQFCPAWIRAFKEFIQDNKLNPLVTDELYYFSTTDPATLVASASRINSTAYFLDRCDTVIATMYSEMSKISNLTGQTLYPDWVDTSTGYAKKTSECDRFSYDTIISDADNCESEQHLLSSYNYYYDATRIAWRIGTDYSWFGDSNALIIANNIARHFNGRAKTIVDGYTITGMPWNGSDRDGFNLDSGGRNHSSTFVSMNACASLSLITEPENAGKWYNETISVKDYDKKSDGTENQYACSGDALRILSLLFMSGNMRHQERLVRIKGIENGFYVTNQNDGINYNDDYLRDYTDMNYVDKTGTTAYSLLKLICLGGNDVAIRVYHTGYFVRRAKDTTITCGNGSNDLKYVGDTFVDNPDLFDINPEAVFTIVDLGTDENGVSKVAFRHKKTGKYIRCSIPYAGLSYAMRLDENTSLFDNTTKIRNELCFSIIPQ